MYIQSYVNIQSSPGYICICMSIFAASNIFPLIHLIGLREKIRNIPYFMGKSMVSGFDFPLVVNPLTNRTSHGFPARLRFRRPLDVEAKIQQLVSGAVELSDQWFQLRAVRPGSLGQGVKHGETVR